MNIATAFVAALSSGCVLIITYVIISHNLYQQKALISIHVHVSNHSYMASLIQNAYNNAPNRAGLPKEPPRLVEEVVDADPKVKHKYINIKRIKDPTYQADLNIMKLKMPDVLTSFKNPCWFEDRHRKTSCRSGAFSSIKIKQPVQLPVLRCLPYFYIAGQPRSGLANIYSRLIRHPDVEAPPYRDIFWIQRHRFVPKCSSLSTYLDYFHEASQKIKSSNVYVKLTKSDYHFKITGDCSGDIMWDNTRWQDLPGNSGCDGPCFTNADYIHHLNPSARIIIALRDPIERVYSDYMAQSVWLKYQPDNEQFNKLIVEQIYQIEECLKNNNSLKFCIYDSSIQTANSPTRVAIGLYKLYLDDWYKVFPKNQIHIIHFEEFTKNTKNEMKKLFNFLNLRPLKRKEMDIVMEDVDTNSREKFASENIMWAETRETLSSFYAEYNKALAQFLGSDKFLWN